MAGLPSGTVTFLFSDIEGSTRMLIRLRDRYTDVLENHHRLLRAAFAEHGGREIRTQGDSFFVAFARARDAVAAAVAGQRALASQPWPNGVEVRVRMGVHTGDAAVGGDDYVGLDVHRAARICSVAHGGEMLVSGATRELVRDELPPDVALKDLGERLLKDLDRPERLFRVVAADLTADFPVPVSVRSAASGAGGNLSLSRDRTIGREEDVKAIADRLFRGARLLTVTGPGGVGKTRLALEVAGELAPLFEDGARFVSLATVSESARVPDAVAEQLAVLVEGEEASAALVRFLASKPLLLVLDNFEHVLGAAALVDELCTCCPELRMLVTSREPLRLAGEYVYQVAPLALPQSGDVLEEVCGAPATALFIERATAQDSEFRATVANADAILQVCRRLGGLPLAIELAAARVPILTADELVQRLDHALTALGTGPRDAPARQQTLRATIDWIYNLLDEHERAALAGIAAFTGGADVGAVEQVTGASLDTLGSLVARNLVIRRERRDGRTRLDLHETIREYAAEHLEARDDSVALRTRHCEYYADFVERAELGLRGHGQREWAKRLDDELDNIRMGMEWSLRQGRSELALRLAAAVASFMCDHRARPSESRRWLEEALDHARGAPRRLRAKALMQLAWPLRELAQADLSLARSHEAVRLARAAGDVPLLACSLLEVAYAADEVENRREAMTAHAEALELARSAGDEWVTALALGANLDYSPFPDALARASEAEMRFRQLGDHNQVSSVLSNIGFVALEQGDYTLARRLIREAVALHESVVDNVLLLAVSVANLGLVAVLEGNDEEARVALRKALQICLEQGLIRPVSEALVAVAALAARRSEFDSAARLAGAAAGLTVERSTRTQARLEAEVRGLAHPALGEGAWRREWERGHAMRFEEAIAYALADQASRAGSDTSPPESPDP